MEILYPTASVTDHSEAVRVLDRGETNEVLYRRAVGLSFVLNGYPLQLFVSLSMLHLCFPPKPGR